MSLTISAALMAGILLPLNAPAEFAPPPTKAACRTADVRISLELLEPSTDQSKETLAKALDTSVLNGSSLEDRLNQLANLSKTTWMSPPRSSSTPGSMKQGHTRLLSSGSAAVGAMS